MISSSSISIIEHFLVIGIISGYYVISIGLVIISIILILKII